MDWKFLDDRTSRRALMRTDLIGDAADALADGFRDLAPAEALLRAMMSERLESPEEAHFWVDVYLSLERRRRESRPAR